MDFQANFFNSYELKTDEITSEDPLDYLRCIVPMKPMLNAFKNTNSLEKNVVTCKIEYEVDADNLILKFRYKYDIIKTHIINLLDGEMIQKLQLPTGYPNSFSSTSSTFHHALQNFQITDSEISFEVNPFKLIIRNYMKNEIQSGQIRSQITIHSTDFHSYQIKDGTEIRFSQKYFRAAIGFAESFHLEVGTNFDRCGKPMILTLKNGTTFDARFILSTLKLNETQQSMDQTTVNRVSKKRKIVQQPEESALDIITGGSDWAEISQAMLNDDDFEEILSQSKQNTNKLSELKKRTTPKVLKPEVRNVFKRCWEATFDPDTEWTKLAEDSD